MPNRRIAIGKARRFALVLAAASLLGACAGNPARAPAVAGMQRLDLRHALADGSADILVDNPWGDVYVRRNPRREVFVHAVVQQLGEPAAHADVDLAGNADTARVRVRFAGAGADCRRPRADGGRWGRVDLSVFVPADVRLRVRSACDGRIDTDHVAGDLEASTDEGDIRISAGGRALLRSGRGDIRAFLNGGGTRPSRIESRGGIVLSMPLSTSAVVEARACGELRASGFAWRPVASTSGCRRAHAQFADGADRISLSSQSFIDMRLRGNRRE